MATGPTVRPSWWAEQDDCLIAIAEQAPIPARKLRVLPPWRAVMIARIGVMAGSALDLGDVDQLVTEATRVGGKGTLGEWWRL